MRLADGPQALLIIDDEEPLGEVTALLSVSGMAVERVSAPHRAVGVARQAHPVAAVLLDILLPTRNLYRLCRRLRSSGGVPLVIAIWEDRTDIEAAPLDRIVPHSRSAAGLADTVLAVVHNSPRAVRITD